MAEIYMIGTQHTCIYGPERLKSKLEDLSPDVVLVEGNLAKSKIRGQYNDFIEKFLREYSIDREIAEEVRKKQARVGYESRISSEYCRENDAEFGYLKDRLKLDSKGKLKSMAREEIQDLIKYRIDKKLYEENIIRRQIKNDDDWRHLRTNIGTDIERESSRLSEDKWQNTKYIGGDRNEVMARTLRECVEKNQEQIIATVTGFAHVLDDPEGRTLYTLVRDLNPKRIFLWKD